MAKLGRPLIPAQRLALDVSLEVDARGRRVHPVVVWLIPRRGGKTVSIGGVLTDLAIRRPGSAGYYTAQRGSKASEWFRQDYLPLLEPLTGIYKSRLYTGRETVSWRNRSLTSVFAPTRDALHSRFSDVAVVDEAWAFDAARGVELLQGIRPTQITRPGAQLFIISAAGDASSSFLNAQLVTAREHAADGNPAVCLVEFGVPDDQDATDIETVERFHPAVGWTVAPGAIAPDRAILGPDGFARAYGCWTPPAEIVATEIDAERWAAAGNPDPMPASLPVVFGFDVGPGRDWAVLAAGRDPAGKVWVDVVDTGTRPDRRLAELITRLYRTTRPRPLIGVDDAGPARDVADTLEAAGVPLTRLAGRDYAAACASFADTVNTDRVRHRKHPELDAAVAALATRPLGDAFAWSRRRAAGTIAPAVAATVAAWLLEHTPTPVKPHISTR
jgi:hypothetical protein